MAVKMSAAAIGLVAFFALLAVSQGAPRVPAHQSSDLELLPPSDDATDMQAPCIDTNFPGGRVLVCPTTEGCQRVNVRIPFPFIDVDVVVCRRNGSEYTAVRMHACVQFSCSFYRTVLQ